MHKVLKGFTGDYYVAAVNPFCFGKFRLCADRNSYTMAEAEISNYFEELRDVSEQYREKIWGHHFKSLETLENLMEDI